MATVVKTWVFAADAEGLADQGAAASLLAQWIASDGNPPGSLEFLYTGGAGAQTLTERARRSSTGQTWETWGVPPGSTVTDVQVTAWDYLVWDATANTSMRTRFRILDSAGTTVHAAGELVDDTNLRANDSGTPHAGPVGTSRAVDAGKQASNTDVRLEVEHGFASSGTPGHDYEVDNIQLTITYTAGGATIDALSPRAPREAHPFFGPF